MPATRATRSTTTKPVAKAATKDKATTTKPAPRSRSTATKKRAASKERSPSPAPKRSRGGDQNVAPRTQKAKTTAAAKDTTKPKSNDVPKKPRGRTGPTHDGLKLAPSVQLKPYFNPLPTPPEHTRPGLQMFAWGAGNCGQFGMGPNVLGELEKPRKNAWAEEQIQEGTFGGEGAGIETAAAGGMHSLFIDEKGSVWSCGLNDDAALGRVTEQVPDPSNPGEFLNVDELQSVPHVLQSLIDEGFRAVQVVAGDSICAAVSDQGELRVWGSFRVNEGSLGFADGQKHQFIPVPILQLSHKPGDSEKVSSIANGANHILVLTTHGNIYAWGASEQGQLGRKVLERRKIHGTVPEKVTLGTRSRKAVAVGAGIYHSFAVDDQGDVWGWGLNSMGQTGTGFDSDDDAVVQQPVKVLRLSKEELGGDQVVSIAGGEHHTLFLTKAGKVYACGRSNAGQLGLEDDDEAFEDRTHPDFLAEPVLVSFPDDDDPVRHISVGLHNNMACTEDGALFCWGQGTQSELGIPEVEQRTPKMIVRREGGSWSAVKTSCGGQHTLGLFRSKK